MLIWTLGMSRSRRRYPSPAVGALPGPLPRRRHGTARRGTAHLQAKVDAVPAGSMSRFFAVDSPGRRRALPTEIAPLVLVGWIDRKPQLEALRLLHEQVAGGAVEADHPAIQEPVLAEKAGEGHPPVVDEEVDVRLPGQVVEGREGELDPLRLCRMRSAADRVVAAIGTTPDRQSESVGRCSVEQRERCARVNQSLHSPSRALVAEDDLDGGAGDVNDLAASGDDSFLGAVREGVVAGRQLPGPDHEAVGRGGDELHGSVGALVTHVSHQDHEISSVRGGGHDPAVLHCHPLAWVPIDADGPPERLDRRTGPGDAHAVKVPRDGQRSLSHAAIL